MNNKKDPQKKHRLWTVVKQNTGRLKAAESVTFDLLIIEIMFLFFKNTVEILKFRLTFYHFRKS